MLIVSFLDESVEAIELRRRTWAPVEQVARSRWDKQSSPLRTLDRASPRFIGGASGYSTAGAPNGGCVSYCVITSYTARDISGIPSIADSNAGETLFRTSAI